ncbi:MAG TPA: hypothetical protein PLN52_02005 [Opitutaceae bacterium]|nr:hypothetical protein [Opitutaceae bacterium]
MLNFELKNQETGEEAQVALTLFLAPTAHQVIPKKHMAVGSAGDMVFGGMKTLSGISS